MSGDLNRSLLTGGPSITVIRLPAITNEQQSERVFVNLEKKKNNAVHEMAFTRNPGMPCCDLSS